MGRKKRANGGGVAVLRGQTELFPVDHEALGVPAFVIYPDGLTEEIKPKGETLSLSEMQEAVDGFIELVPGGPVDGYLLFVNEEGLIRQLPHNIRASRKAGIPVVGVMLVVREELVK